MLKNYFYAISHFFCLTIILTFIITIIDYYSLLPQLISSILKLITIILNFFFTGFYIGKRSTKKGYLEGIKLGLTIITIFLIFTILISKLEIKAILYYVILLSSTILGSMMGISIKKE